MKKLIIFMFFTVLIFAKGSSNENSSSSGEKTKVKSESSEKVIEKKENENLRDDVAKYNWGQEKEEYGSKEERDEAKDTVKHYSNLMKIMYNYQYRITNSDEYLEFLRLYENGELKIDEETMKKISLEFQRYEGLIREEEYEKESE